MAGRELVLGSEIKIIRKQPTRFKKGRKINDVTFNVTDNFSGSTALWTLDAFSVS
jgi:hypothetical protein